MLHDEPEKVEECLEVMREKDLETVKISVDSPAEGFIFWEDSSTTNINPAMFQKYTAPIINEWGKIIHKEGKMLVHHACGHIKDLLPLMRETEIDAIESITPVPTGNIEMKEAKNMLEGSGISLIGGIDPVFFTTSKMDELEEYITHFTFYMTMATDYENRMQEQPLEKENIGNILKELIKDRLETALSKGWKAIWEVHKRDVQKLFEASSLHIETKDGQELENLDFLYQYGRYLLFSSSREDSVLPAHLQGIWNDNVACRIGWTCDMHLDINTQMNYWPSELTGLSETASPLFRWVKALAKEGELTAKKCYGQKGWVAELVSNSWLFTAPYWAEPIAPCPTGGVWVLSHLWEHYFYTGDEEFLKMEVYPLMKGAVSFFLNYLFENEEGYLVGGPSISPENSFVFDGEILQISNGCTYEILMIRELFEKYCQVCEILKETEMVTEVKNVLQRLLPYRISEDGSLAEWEKDYKEADVQHRHTSHLLGLFPFAQITRDKTPELIPAVEKVLEKKQNPPENWEDTGWARSMLMLYEARLGHGEKAWQHILSMMERLQEPNHMIYHPPTRGAGAFDHVYELDGNTGLTTCVAEMLLQSQEQVIQLLPAVPKEWYRGQVKGLHARGGIEVGFSWESGRVQNCSLKAKRDCCVRIRANDREWEVSLKGGEIYNFT